MNPRPLATVTVEERAEGSFVILRTHAGGQVHYGPFSPDGVEAAIMHLGSALVDNAVRGLGRGLDNLRREMDNRFGDRSDPPR